MNSHTKNTEMLTATISFRLTENECRTLAVRADREQRIVSTRAERTVAERAVAADRLTR